MFKQEIIPEIMVKDVRSTVAFYQNYFPCTLVAHEPQEGTWHWAQISLGDYHLSFKSETRLKAEFPVLKNLQPGGSIILCFMLEHVEQIYESIQDQIEVLIPLNHSACGNLEFTFLDPNGYIVTISHPEAVAKDA